MMIVPRAPRSRPRWSLLPMLALGSCSITLLTACDPCSGIARCNVATQLVVGGQIVRASGEGVDGVTITVVPSGGIAMAGDSVSTTTEHGGFWRVALQPQTAGQATVDVQVTRPGISSYRVRDVAISTNERGGDSNQLPQWVAEPYFNDVGEFYYRGSDVRIELTPIRLSRLSGVMVHGSGVVAGMIDVTTEGLSGRVALFPAVAGAVLADGTGELIVSATASLPTGPSTNRVTLLATHLYRQPQRIVRVGLGPSIAYQVALESGALRTRLAGVPVRVERIGGISVTGLANTTSTNADGRIAIRARALAVGVLDLRLIVGSASGAQPDTVVVHLPTFDEDGDRFFGVLSVGTTPAGSAVRVIRVVGG